MQALDTFNTAVVSPIYYVMFTSLTILASVIMFKVIIVAYCICTYISVYIHMYMREVFAGQSGISRLTWRNGYFDCLLVSNECIKLETMFH